MSQCGKIASVTNCGIVIRRISVGRLRCLLSCLDILIYKKTEHLAEIVKMIVKNINIPFNPDRFVERIREFTLTKTIIYTAALLNILFLIGCSTPEQNLALGIAAATVYGSYSPNNEIEQVYYLGVFDPQEQIPDTIYRVRVRGQASFLSFKKFASGWVRADLIDTLGSQVGFKDGSGNVSITRAEGEVAGAIPTGRRLMIFGPEGFREAPKDHRLVILMGSSPEDFFNAIDTSIGTISKAISEQNSSRLNTLLFKALSNITNERKRLNEFAKDVQADIPNSREVDND